jgi:hypothetical protein
MMNTVEWSTYQEVFVFLDDIVIYANVLVDHDRKFRDVFRRLRKHNLKLQTDKCDFLRKEVTFPGHKISELGVETYTRK